MSQLPRQKGEMRPSHAPMLTMQETEAQLRGSSGPASDAVVAAADEGRF
jgi:hypothetical protein